MPLDSERAYVAPLVVVAREVVVVGATVVVVVEFFVAVPLFVAEADALFATSVVVPETSEDLLALFAAATARDVEVVVFSLELAPGISTATAVPTAAEPTVAAIAIAAVTSLSRRLTAARVSLPLPPACGAGSSFAMGTSFGRSPQR